MGPDAYFRATSMPLHQPKVTYNDIFSRASSKPWSQIDILRLSMFQVISTCHYSLKLAILFNTLTLLRMFIVPLMKLFDLTELFAKGAVTKGGGTMIKGPKGASFFLHLALVVLFFNGFAAAQEVSTSAPPVWSIGEWWVVECQVYNTGKVRRGAIPGWTPRQGWRFEVEGSESIAGQPYFVVSIRPNSGNRCPYWFRYWFRASDRYVGRSELHHAEQAASKPGAKGPSVIRQDFADMPPDPYLTDEFPSLPVSMPLFNSRHQLLAGDEKSEVSQGFENLAVSEVLEKVDSRMTVKLEAEAGARNLLAVLGTVKFTERQYWNSRLPWCLYGERTVNGQDFRRYWLVDVGRK
jgi:hypothetical protein